jgi:hypothetical protein
MKIFNKKQILLMCAGVALCTLPVIAIKLESSAFQDGAFLSYEKGICDDLMSTLVEKPSTMEFLECKAPRKTQVKTLIATYRVTGKDARSAEQFLQQNFKMSKLKFLCCGWDTVSSSGPQGVQPGHGRYIDRQGFYHDVAMYSEETLLNNHQDWSKIPFFYIVVKKFLEDP